MTLGPISSLTQFRSRRRALLAFVDLLRTIRCLNPHEVPTQTPRVGVLGLIAGRLAGVPVVIRAWNGVDRAKRFPWHCPAHRGTVLHVLPNDQDRGAQVYARQLVDALALDSEHCHLIVTLFDSPDAAARADIRLRVSNGPLRRALDPRAVARLRRVIRAEPAALIVAHGGEALKYVVPAAGRIPTIYYKVGLSSAEISRPCRRHLYRNLSKRVTRVVGVSQAVADQAIELLGVPADRTAVIPNGRDPELYRPLAAGEQQAEPPRLLWVGRLEPGKRPGLFLDVVKELRGRGIDFSAAMVGDGPLRSGLEDRASRLGVDILGVRRDVPQLLRESSVLMMTSAADTEGMPGVVIEAGLSGIPVVSTCAAGVADVVMDGETGVVLRSDTPTDLAKAAAGILTDSAAREEMGKGARAQCMTHFTTEASARRWIEVVLELTSNLTRTKQKRDKA